MCKPRSLLKAELPKAPQTHRKGLCPLLLPHLHKASALLGAFSAVRALKVFILHPKTFTNFVKQYLVKRNIFKY